MLDAAARKKAFDERPWNLGRRGGSSDWGLHNGGEVHGLHPLANMIDDLQAIRTYAAKKKRGTWCVCGGMPVGMSCRLEPQRRPQLTAPPFCVLMCATDGRELASFMGDLGNPPAWIVCARKGLPRRDRNAGFLND